ncbi:hypothetical protein RT99_03120 [Flavobacterium sp. MEB061]|uniref:T9SS type A sorting domain-containing protein n=1 Tax=Flavobacterium sp. MEB061 TaxID=1587524 RepID=UPI0005ABEA32|nr:T9SS type A sorting domain-containing protein [Flavobacterium sp. MEB061]KIQ24088.1 hypothetical protein RT99_03120 [Flavobacterium sp. MEB061]
MFTTLFYGQVTHITTCSSEPFDLTSLKNDFIGNLDPAETNVTYFLSLDDALNNANIIADPTHYFGVIGLSNIYGRIDYNGIISTNYFNLRTIESLKITASHTPIICSEETSSLTINTSGGIGSYQYSINGGPFTSNNYYKYLLSGTYHIKVKDGSQMCIASIDHVITAPATFTATSITVNQNTTITPTGGTEPYLYSLDGATYQASNVFSDLPVGFQPIYVRDARGCSVFTTIVVGDSEFPLSSGGMTLKHVTCWGNAAIRAFGYGGHPPYLYSIDGGTTFQTSDTFDNLSAGTYPIAIKDSENTIVNNLAIELLPYIPVNCTTIVTNTSSCINNGGINIVANGGQIPHYYSIDGGTTFSAENTFSDLPAGNYTVLVKDSNDCISPAITAKIQQASPLSATALHTELLCAKDKTSITINAVGGEAPYQYAINNSIYSLNNTHTDLSPGTYQIKVKDAVGCIATFEHIIAQPTPIYADILAEGQTVTLNGQAGTAPYQYSIDGVAFQAENVFTNLSSGIHTVRIKDSKGCESYDFSITIEDQKPLASAVAITKEMDCLSNASIAVNATGGKPPYLYSINGGSNYFSSNIFSDLTANTYTVKVQDADHNSTTNTVVINPPTFPIITLTTINATCNGRNNGLIKATVIGGSAPYLYSLTGTFQTGDTFNNLASGIYDVTVKDNNGCTSVVSVAITEPTLLTATVSTFEQSIATNALGGNPPYSYSLEKEGIIVAAPQSNNTFTNLPTGIYSVKIADANSCTLLSSEIYVAPPPTLSATVVTNAVNCFQPTGTITINATGGIAPYLYSINNGNNYVPSNVFSNLSAGTYIIKVKDTQNATTTLAATISPSLAATAVVMKGIDCVSNGSINVTAAGGSGNYQYSLNGGSFQASNIFNNLTAGTYHFTIKDSNNCTVLTNDIVFVQPVPLTATISYQPITDCSTSPITSISISGVGGTAPYQYSINNYNYQSTGSYAGVFPGTHIIKVKDASGCVYTTPLIIASPTSLRATATVNKATECGIKDSVTINATGGQAPYTYSFTGGVSFINANTSSDLIAGNHTVFVKDSNGCNYTTYVTVEQSILSATTTTDVYNKTIRVNVTGGKTPYKYTLKKNSEIIIGSQNENIFNNVAFGSYVVEVTDANGCVVSSDTELYSPLIISAVITRPTAIENFGTIKVVATGGLAPYKYSINGDNYTANNIFTNLVPGIYIIDVRDSSNNISSLYVVIEPLNPLTATIANTNISCYGSQDGAIVANASGGLAPYTYSLYNNGIQITANSSMNSFSNLPAGSYKVKIDDSAGYTFLSNNIFISQPATLMVSSATVENQTITVTTTGGNGLYEYSFDGASFQSSNIFNSVPYGIHEIYVRDQNGCAAVMSVNLDPPAPSIEGKNSLAIEFTPGQTLADLVVEGQNIKWYSNPNSLSGKTNKTAETTLPLTTVLVNGTTYYASQTINGIESKERLAVTTKAKGTLSNPDFVLPDFTYYPNPVQHSLSIHNTSNIDEVEIFSVAGKFILSNKVNSDHSEIDLSNVSSGVYFLKVKAEGQTKTIKIVKK